MRVFSLAAVSAATWYNVGLIVVLLSLLIVGTVAYRAWHEAHEDIEPVSPEDLLASFEEARAAGELDDEEYERVRQRIREGGPGPGPN